MILLLAINVFPLIWAIRLSFTGFMANLPNPAGFIGLDNYTDILTDEDVWAHFQTTAHFVLSTIALQVRARAWAWRCSSTRNSAATASGRR